MCVSGTRIWNLARRDEVRRDKSTQLDGDGFRPGMREPASCPAHSAHGGGTNSAMSGQGRGLDHLGRFLAVAVHVAGSTTTFDDEENGGQQCDDDAT